MSIGDDIRRAHDGWVRDHLPQLGDRFHQRVENSDYNLHVLDLEATAEEERDYLRRVQPMLERLRSRR